jgi:HSP20 family molecular chaperone IbpA
MSTVSVWTRPRPFASPFAEFDALVRAAFGPQLSRTARSVRPAGFTPAAEVTREGSDAVVKVEIPGVDVEKDVIVEIDHGQLVIRGERRDERTSENEGAAWREVRYGSFRRSFGLPGHVAADAITATYDAGVLSVRVAGAYTEAETQRVAISPPAAKQAEPELEAATE